MYHFSEIVYDSYLQTIERTKIALSNEGFGVLTEIDIQATLKEKIDVDFRPYTILGACNPPFAFKALRAEDKIGTMLPCNVVIQVNYNCKTEVSAVDPLASMVSIKNETLSEIAHEIGEKLRKVVKSI